jgi:general secretion pathway protein A
MYESFYGLTCKPFQLNPDPAFYFASKQHRRAMAYLEYGLNQNEGFIVVTGEVGAGKTTIVRGLLNDLDSEKVVAAQLVSTQLDAEDTLRMIAARLRCRHPECWQVGNAACPRGLSGRRHPSGQALSADC